MAYKALSTANLPDPVIDPAQGDSPEDYFNTVLYTGTGAAVDINTVGFQPDLVWGKKRSAPNQNNWLIDSVRGAGVWLSSDGTGSEGTEPAGSSFDADGFNTNSNSLFTYNGGSYVLWAWKAGGSGVSNTNGSITSTVSASTESGFSIVSYTGNDAASATVGHGLSQQAPEMVIVKNRQEAISNPAWPVYHSSSGATKFLDLQTTAAQGTATTVWNDTTPTSSLVTIGTADSVNSGSTHIMYCFHSVDGFSRIGSYTGNGSADGTFVYTGFRPAFVMFKNISASSTYWIMFDVERDTHNVMDTYLQAQASNAEASFPFMDFLSNGFKHRHTSSHTNTSGQTYIYMAFAEQPFKFSNAR